MTNNCPAKTINEALTAGKTVVIATRTNAWKLTQKVRERFAKVGIELIREKAGSVEMAQGRKYVDVSFCSIRISK